MNKQELIDKINYETSVEYSRACYFRALGGDSDEFHAECQRIRDKRFIALTQIGFNVPEIERKLFGSYVHYIRQSWIEDDI